MMQKLKVLIIEDENVHYDILYDRIIKFAVRYNLEIEINRIDNACALMKIDNRYDIIFLDIMLDEHNSISTVVNLRKNGIISEIIITTCKEEFVLDGYKVRAHRYLIKPITESNFNEAFSSCISDIKKSTMKIKILSNYVTNIIYAKDIIYIESVNRRRKIVLPYEKIETFESFKDINDKLPDKLFGMPHKSYIVSFQHIESVKKSTLMMINGDEIPVSRNKADSFFCKFHVYVEGTIK